MKSDKPDKIEFLPAIASTLEASVGVVSDVKDKNERESTRQAKERFMAVFESAGGASVSIVARQAGISRDTYYRWLREDKEFKNKVRYVQRYLNDFVEDLLLMKILKGDGPSIRFYLTHRHPKYMSRKQVYVYPGSEHGQKTLEDLLDDYENSTSKNIEKMVR